MNVQRFIRIDNVGQWKGTEHKSFLSMVDDEAFEGGISCYIMKEGCIKELYNYWKFEVWNTESKDRQITIFEGNEVGTGSSYENLATCTQTIMQLPASMLFDNLEFFESVEDGFEYYDNDEEEEISMDDEIFNGLDKYEIVEKAIFRAVGLE